MIRESAILFLGFTPWDTKGVLGSRAFYSDVRSASPDSGDCILPRPRRARTTGRISRSNWGPPWLVQMIQLLMERLGLRRVLLDRDLLDGALQVLQDFGHRRAVFHVEGVEFVDDVTALLQAWVAKHLAAGDHLIGDAAEAKGDLHVCVPWIFAGQAPAPRQGAEVLIALDQIVGDAEDGRADCDWRSAPSDRLCRPDRSGSVTDTSRCGR